MTAESALAKVRDENQRYAKDLLRLVADLKYIGGIAERGRGYPLIDDEAPKLAILEYVKNLEAAIRALKEGK